MPKLTLILPNEVTFSVPRQYATFCKNTIVGVTSTEQEDRALRIIAEDERLAFAHGKDVVSYQRDRVVELVVDPSEEVRGQTLCTLRVVFVEADGQKGSLPILTTNAHKGERVIAIGRALQDLGLPVRVSNKTHDGRAGT